MPPNTVAQPQAQAHKPSLTVVTESAHKEKENVREKEKSRPGSKEEEEEKPPSMSPLSMSSNPFSPSCKNMIFSPSMAGGSGQKVRGEKKQHVFI